jgi:hypothetical protein
VLKTINQIIQSIDRGAINEIGDKLVTGTLYFACFFVFFQAETENMMDIYKILIFLD